VSKKKQLTILLVGETGVGKTALLDLIGNTLQGVGPETYQETHFPSNEAGGSKGASQTKDAMVYEFQSLNGIRIRVLDTPGLADTRGLAYDDEHKSSIVQAIRDKIQTIDGVLIVANGTIERLPVATDYALTTLASIFPRSVVDNVAFIFTMVSNPLGFNFKLDSLPEHLKKAKYYLLENPIVQYKRLRLQATLPQSAMNLNKTRQTIDKNYLTSMAMLVKLFGWLDQREPRQTTAIVELYEASCNIDRRIQTVVELRRYLGTLGLESEEAAQARSQLNLTDWRHYLIS
jgi:Predicted GTPase